MSVAGISAIGSLGPAAKPAPVEDAAKVAASPQDANAFDKSVARADMPEIQATSPHAPNRMFADISSRMDMIANGAGKDTQAAAFKTAATEGKKGGGKEIEIGDVMKRYEDASIYAMTANVAITGATDVTKDANNLWKGQ